MSYTAYLVGFLDVKKNPPQFTGAGIFSEPSPTIEGFPFTIAETEGKTYEEAEKRLKKYMMNPILSWAWKYVPPDYNDTR